MSELVPAAPSTYLGQICCEVQRVYPEYTWPFLPPDAGRWMPIGPVQPCESCGTRIFLLRHWAGARDWAGARRWCQVGHVVGVDPNAKVKLVFHEPQRCRDRRARQS